MNDIILYLIVGLISGTVGGMFGLGGGAIMVPLFVLLFGLTQHQAQGTALAVMLPPVFLLAVLRYYYAGNVNVPMAIYIGLGFFVGGFIGAHFAQNISAPDLKRAFGIFIILIGIKMAFFK